jgi:pimeloyl-ACP methyl ester carboxylesterase
VLVGSAGFGSDVSLGLRLVTLPILGEWLTQPGRANARQTLRALFHDAALITPERVEQEHRRSALPGAQSAFLRVARALMNPWGGKRPWIDSLQARLRHVAAPILIVWGACDQVVPVHHCTAALTYFTHASAHIIGSCGHFPQIERPQEFAAIVLRFLAQDKRAC